VINPKTILGEWVDCAPVLPGTWSMGWAATADNIRAFMEGLATDNNLRLAILLDAAPARFWLPGNGTTPAASHWRITALRASLLDLLGGRRNRNSTATYADLFWLLVERNNQRVLHLGRRFCISRSIPTATRMDIGSALRAAKHGCGERGRGDPRLFSEVASNARGAGQSRRRMRTT